MLCIQGAVVYAVGADLAADAPAVFEILRALLEMRDMRGKNLCERALAEAYGTDILQTEVKRAEKPDFSKGVQILFRIVPVAVGIPCRPEQPFCFIETDVCSCHAGQVFNFFYRHCVSPPAV